jgi:hypothetical protein
VLKNVYLASNKSMDCLKELSEIIQTNEGSNSEGIPKVCLNSGLKKSAVPIKRLIHGSFIFFATIILCL